MWTKVIMDSGITKATGKIQFVNQSTGWIGGILKTTDGGITWKAQTIPSLSFPSAYFTNANLGWIVGDYIGQTNIFRTTDGGTNWIPCNDIPISAFNTVRFVSETTGWVVGGYQISGQFSSTIIKTTDGGNSWISQDCPTTQELSNLFFINGSTGWSVGNGIFKTTNGGVIASVKDEKGLRNNIPDQIKLFQNYPNPFNPTTTIEYQIPLNVGTQNFVSLRVYDLLGREVETLVNEQKPAGRYTQQWNAERLSSGIYFYRLRTGVFSETKKMILLR